MRRRAFIQGSAIVTGRLVIRSHAFARAFDVPGTAARLATDPRRPQYHLLPAANWMNDPNGPIYWRGEYHMFYQYNPHAAVWGDMHWGHAVSADMVHWRHLPVALAPTPGGPDAAGCFTGSALADGERVAVLYTGVVSAPESDATIRDGAHSLRESQCLAFGEGNDLTVWTKIVLPVITAPPAGLAVTGFRDPALWRDGSAWYAAIGSGIRGKHGMVLLYRSEDLYRWEYLHPLIEGKEAQAATPAESGDMWECPDFFPLGDKHVLIHSIGGKVYWQCGAFDTSTLKFQPERSGVLDYGSFYAAKTQLDSSRNRILWGWITEERSEAEFRAAGWAGMMSLPRVLSLDANHDLMITPAREVERLRRRKQQVRISGNEEADRRKLARMRVEDCCGEIACELRKSSHPVTFSLVSPDDNSRPWLTCRYDPAHASEIVVDDKSVHLGELTGRDLEIRFLIDGSVIECFANRHAALTKRFYFSGSVAPPIALHVDGKPSSLSAVTMWQMSPISPDRLTS